ncbi:hypothetical protein GCM10022224_016860 [Nonomuraea antimicrobica]|uniref:Transmembrane protein n=1 Tax=Nonomuraea antimicrobica TaxID=561173 RepID=A0ABP7BBP2_9ACTN
MEFVGHLAIVVILLVVVLWWLLAFVAAGFGVSVGVTVARHGARAWCKPGLWARLAVASALGCTAVVGYGLIAMEGFGKLDSDDPCTIDDDLMGNHPLMEWPLSDTSCGGYESVPAFVNPAICLLGMLFCAFMVVMVMTRRKFKRRPSPELDQTA